MIEPLRRRHRWMIAAVTVVVVPLLFAALAARPERPYEESLEGRFEMAAGDVAAGRAVEFGTKPPITIAIGKDGSAVTVDAPKAVELPGLLLYWQPDAREFPSGAVLLGAVRGHGRTTLSLDDDLTPSGSFVIYSLGHGEEVARVEWPRGTTP